MKPGKYERGFTYIAMLIAVAVLGMGLAATGTVWSQAAQREKEAELLFIGDQFRRAIALYYQRTPGPVKRYPAKLDDLLADDRYPKAQRYLRKIYTDPMTGTAEWGLIEAPAGGIMGVYSRSAEAPVKTSGFDPANQGFEGAQRYSDWKFFHEDPLAAQPQQAGSQALRFPGAPRG